MLGKYYLQIVHSSKVTILIFGEISYYTNLQRKGKYSFHY